MSNHRAIPDYHEMCIYNSFGEKLTVNVVYRYAEDNYKISISSSYPTPGEVTLYLSDPELVSFVDFLYGGKY